jgi:hypothetical protein
MLVKHEEVVRGSRRERGGPVRGEAGRRLDALLAQQGVSAGGSGGVHDGLGVETRSFAATGWAQKKSPSGVATPEGQIRDESVPSRRAAQRNDGNDHGNESEDRCERGGGGEGHDCGKEKGELEAGCQVALWPSTKEPSNKSQVTSTKGVHASRFVPM